MQCAGTDHRIIIFKPRSQHLITRGIAGETWYCFKDKKFTFHIVMQHPGNDIGSDLFHLWNKLHFTWKIISLIIWHVNMNAAGQGSDSRSLKQGKGN
ncbi:MAG: hypothetical protein D4R97_05660 [Bacteroidetes bacterium]|nr:MAG: hypothetical protein D4R97_05660 [Bacteroidota bacterium]